MRGVAAGGVGEGEEQADGAGLGLSLGSQCYVDICGTLLEAYRAMLHVAYSICRVRGEGGGRKGAGGVASHNHNELN